ncbi:conserved hypothetical protein [Thiomonas arsenitoxydans]|uniref:Uncharacterized protein n=1 Tax=Thiomonas arsenitoxydans (strain DSM 22701 / CIP 110005 / 3As) TaxID=426114 RepID=D6CPH5_THIA3|nr:hypothetical protein THI_1212 [Thiomonas arsenitoxydans]CQR26565.1 conserved hypothetical protein [Thiomonas arsenitoxydans]
MKSMNARTSYGGHVLDARKKGQI